MYFRENKNNFSMLKRGQQCKKADLIENIEYGEIELDYLLVSFF